MNRIKLISVLSEHILVEFLVRLPFKSLIQFRCVSKSWRDLIDSRYLTGIHSTRSRRIDTHPHPDSRIIAAFEKGIDTKLYAIDYDSVVKKQGKIGCYTAIAKQLSMPEYFNEKKNIEKGKFNSLECKKFDLVGSCNGILCVYTYAHLILWNPFTDRTCLKLPSPPHEFIEGYRYNFRPASVCVAFGYDHINDDYKVVKYYQNCPVWSVNPAPGRYGLCVYSLKHKLWTTISPHIPFDIPEDYFFTHSCTSANGALHWLVEEKKFIVAFDLATYEFRKLPCCRLSEDPCDIDMRLFSFNGCLSLMCYYEEDDKDDFWMMEEYGVGTSWTKLVSIKMKSGIYTPVAFIEGRRKLLLKSSQGLTVYDVERRVLTRVEEELYTSAYCVCVASFSSPTT